MSHGIYDTFVSNKYSFPQSFFFSYVISTSCYFLVEPIQRIRHDTFNASEALKKDATVTARKIFFEQMKKKNGIKSMWKGSSRFFLSSLTMSSCVCFFDYFGRDNGTDASAKRNHFFNVKHVELGEVNGAKSQRGVRNAAHGFSEMT